MRSIYKIVPAASVILIITSLAWAQQSSFHQEVFTQARPGARVAVDGSAYHQVSWVTSGAPGACLLALDYSEDGMVWYLGGTIPIRDCTRSNQTTIVHQQIKYVRMNLNTLSHTAAIRATYAGYQTNPGPTGTVTSVFGRTGDVLAAPGDFSVADITGAAPLFSPNLTGSPTSATPPPGDNSNRIATTAFVNQIFSNCCQGGGGGTAGVSSFNGRTGAVVPEAQDYAAFFAPIGGGGTGAVSSVFGRTGAVVAANNDYAVGQVTGAAPLASPTFTGTPQAPTPATNNNSLQIATTAFVMAHAGTSVGGDATGLNFSGTTIPLGAAPASGQYLTFNGTNIVGGPGGAPLVGCVTPASGNLVCDVSVQGGTGPSGLVTLPYTGTTLPSPPASASIAGLTANSNGLFWSPGNGAAFTQIGAGGGGGTTGTAHSLVFGTSTIPLSSTAPATGHLLIYDGTNISGIDPTAIPGLGGGGGGAATALQFGTTTFVHSTTAPTSGECLAVNQGAVVGITCGGAMGGVTEID